MRIFQEALCIFFIPDYNYFLCLSIQEIANRTDQVAQEESFAKHFTNAHKSYIYNVYLPLNC